MPVPSLLLGFAIERGAVAALSGTPGAKPGWQLHRPGRSRRHCVFRQPRARRGTYSARWSASICPRDSWRHVVVRQPRRSRRTTAGAADPRRVITGSRSITGSEAWRDTYDSLADLRAALSFVRCPALARARHRRRQAGAARRGLRRATGGAARGRAHRRRADWRLLRFDRQSGHGLSHCRARNGGRASPLTGISALRCRLCSSCTAAPTTKRLSSRHAATATPWLAPGTLPVRRRSRVRAIAARTGGRASGGYKRELTAWLSGLIRGRLPFARSLAVSGRLDSERHRVLARPPG